MSNKGWESLVNQVEADLRAMEAPLNEAYSKNKKLKAGDVLIMHANLASSWRWLKFYLDNEFKIGSFAGATNE